MRAGRLAVAVAALAVAAFVAGAVVLLTAPTVVSGAATTTRQAPAAPDTTTPPAVELTPTASATRVATGEGQSPGTVRLPHGGTAELVRRELTADGTLPIPDDLDEATWWGAGLGAERGVALLSGHVNWGGRTGPFAELWRDRPGQRVTVRDATGGRWVYRIVDTLTLHKDELPRHAPRLFSQQGPHRLVLVTCGGEYTSSGQGYVDNRIVTAELLTRP